MRQAVTEIAAVFLVLGGFGASNEWVIALDNEAQADFPRNLVVCAYTK